MKRIVLALICVLPVFLPSCATTGESLSPNTEMYYQSALLCAQQNKFDVAISLYSEVLKRHPAFAEAYFNRGLSYYYYGSAEKALSDFSRAITLGFHHSIAYLFRGKAYADKGEFTKARADWTKALALNPNETEAAKYLEELDNRGE